MLYIAAVNFARRKLLACNAPHSTQRYHVYNHDVPTNHGFHNETCTLYSVRGALILNAEQAGANLLDALLVSSRRFHGVVILLFWLGE